MIVTVAILMPAMMAGSASGRSTRQSICQGVSPLARALGHLAQAGDDVAEQDQQRVRDECDLRARHGQPRDRDHELEERKARDRVEERGEDRERGLEPPEAVGGERGHERDREADPHGYGGQLDVLDQARREHAVEVVHDPVEAELPVLADAVAAALEFRDHRALLSEDGSHAPTGLWSGPIKHVIVSSATVPFGWPSPSRTVTRWTPSVSISDRTSRSKLSLRAVGPAARSGGRGSRSSWLSRHTFRRLRPRSAPTKSATNSFAGAARMLSGVSYWTSSPSRRIAIRWPILIASSMSCVTKTTVFGTSACRRRKSSWRRSRVMGSRAPNGSSMSMSGCPAAIARATPIRCCWPPENSPG